VADEPIIPSELSRRINAERILLLGWTRAVLLQLAHPLIAAGVADHSTFRGSTVAAFSRLHHTVHAMLALTFGDDVERERALEAIRAIHRRVHGTLPAACGRFPAGTRYSAEDPALLLWVHVTLIESIVLVYERLVAPLNDAERDRYCTDSADVAISLGARAGAVPCSWRALQACLDEGYGTGSIVVSGQARDLAAALLSPVPGRAAAPLTAVATLLAAGLLPAQVRREYGFRWSPGRERAFGMTLSVLRATGRLLPRWITWWPQARRWLASARHQPSA
jgi:uncharacterized protein (DUF2236 family)